MSERVEPSQSGEDLPNPFQGIDSQVKDSIRKKIEEHKSKMDTKRITKLEARVEYLVVLVHNLQKLTKHLIDATKVEIPSELTDKKVPRPRSNSKKTKKYGKSSYFGKKSGKDRYDIEEQAPMDTTAELISSPQESENLWQEKDLEREKERNNRGQRISLKSENSKSATIKPEPAEVHQLSNSSVSEQEEEETEYQPTGPRPQRMKHVHRRSKRMVVIERLVLGQITMADARKILHCPSSQISKMVEMYMTRLDEED